MRKSVKFSPEVRERAVRRVQVQRGGSAKKQLVTSTLLHDRLSGPCVTRIKHRKKGITNG